MRILVLSDSHGNSFYAEKAIEMLCPDRLIFLGDGLREIENLSYIYSKIPFSAVRGNCDFYSDEPAADILNVGSHKIFFTHGHLYRVKDGTDTLLSAAKQRGADIALYGHTHIARTEYSEGVYIINPGSCSCPREGKRSCAYIDIIGNDILTNTVEL